MKKRVVTVMVLGLVVSPGAVSALTIYNVEPGFRGATRTGTASQPWRSVDGDNGIWPSGAGATVIYGSSYTASMLRHSVEETWARVELTQLCVGGALPLSRRRT